MLPVYFVESVSISDFQIGIPISEGLPITPKSIAPRPFCTRLTVKRGSTDISLVHNHGLSDLPSR